VAGTRPATLGSVKFSTASVTPESYAATSDTRAGGVNRAKKLDPFHRAGRSKPPVAYLAGDRPLDGWYYPYAISSIRCRFSRYPSLCKHMGGRVN